MAEWFKAQAWKACVLSKVPWVRIPLSPPLFNILMYINKEYYRYMKQGKSLTQKQYEECYAKALTYIAQILVAAFFIAVLIFSIF